MMSTVTYDELSALHQILTGTADATGERFFRKLVQHMAEALGVRYGLVAVYNDGGRSATMLAFWDGVACHGPQDFDLDGTPCAKVAAGDYYHCVDHLGELFPDDPYVTELSVVSYRGVPLVGPSGVQQGHLAVMDTQPMPTGERFTSIMEVFAVRAAAEMDRLAAEQAVRESERRLRHQSTEIAEIQRSLLPRTLPAIPTLSIAAHYEPADQAGGDYYDFLPLPNGRWGILIADVAGHGTPASVLMAVVHAVVHTHNDLAHVPSAMLTYLNDQLARRYSLGTHTFVTAFYGVYDPATRQMTYANAGHHAPRVKRGADGSHGTLDGLAGMPLGILEDQAYPQHAVTLQVDDQVLLFTDGIIEARVDGEQFGTDRLDRVLDDGRLDAPGLVRSVLDALHGFIDGRPMADDQTLVVLKLTA